MPCHYALDVFDEYLLIGAFVEELIRGYKSRFGHAPEVESILGSLPGLLNSYASLLMHSPMERELYLGAIALIRARRM